jgi:uncharacterized protein (TIGR02246 family)
MENKMKISPTHFRPSIILAIFTLALLTVNAQKLTNSKAAADETLIRASVQQMEDGWNTKSGSLFAKPFAEDADYVVINGRHLQGRALIEESHQQIFDTIFKNTRISLSVKQIRFLRSDVAVVHVNGHRESSETSLHQSGVLTLVMTKDKSGWKIVAFQNTAVVEKP